VAQAAEVVVEGKEEGVGKYLVRGMVGTKVDSEAMVRAAAMVTARVGR